MKFIFILLLLNNTCVLAAPGHSTTDSQSGSPGAQLFYKALAQYRDGNWTGAMELLKNLITRFPKDQFCDDAMAKMAQLQEEQMGQPTKALETWRSLAKTFPHSRLARRARIRAEFLSEHLDQGPEVLAEYERLLRTGARMNVDEAVNRMKALIDTHPEFSLKAQGLLFIAELLEKSGDFEKERKILESVIHSSPGSQEAGLAMVKIGRLAMQQGRLDEAESAFEMLKSLPGKQWSTASEEYLARLSNVKTRHWTLWIALTLWVLVLLSMILALALVARSGGWSFCWPPPLELWFFFVAMRTLISIVWAHAHQAAVSLSWMTGLMAPVIVGNGLLLRKIRVSGPGRYLWITAGLLTVFLCVYAAICLSGMLDQVLHTIRFGTD